MAQLISRLIATIANGAYLSDAVTLNGKQVAVIEMPATWTAAVLTFQSSMDGANYFNVYDADGNEVFIIAEAGRRIHVDIQALSQQKYIKIRSGLSVNCHSQAAQRLIYVEVWTA